jgi:hypothetical protein
MHTTQSPLNSYGVIAIEMVLVIIPIKRFEVQDLRPVAKDLVGFKSICKNAKSAVKSEKGLLFDAIRQQPDKIIEECEFESAPNAFKFKVKNCVRLGSLGPIGHVINTTKRCVQIDQDEDVFKAGANIKIWKEHGNCACLSIRWGDYWRVEG